MKVILNILTHGDEKIGLKVASEINKLKINKKCLVIQIANAKAFKAHKRFIDQDLNRSFPGKKNGNHEERLAYKLSPSIKKADIVIDVHSTTSNLKDAVIITKFDDETLKYVDSVHPRYVLVMTVTKDSALMSQAKVGIAFEFGKDSSPIAVKKTVLGVKNILARAGLLHLNNSRNKRIIATKYYEVTDIVAKPKGYSLIKGVKNYQMIKRGAAYAFCGDKKIVAKENFYPILFGEKKYKDYFGFKGKKLKR